MADLHIDTSNVTLMGEFKSAIEDYVQKYIQGYVSFISQGVHETQQLKAEASESSGKSTLKETIAVSINISAPNTMHWGILNVKRINEINSLSQIIFWWDNNEFKYRISYNSLLARYSYVAYPNIIQYIDNNTITFKNNVLSFNIINDIYIDAGRHRMGGKFEVDYHIW